MSSKCLKQLQGKYELNFYLQRYTAVRSFIQLAQERKGLILIHRKEIALRVRVRQDINAKSWLIAKRGLDSY